MDEFDRGQEMRYHIFALDHGVTLHRTTKAEGQITFGSALREDRC